MRERLRLVFAHACFCERDSSTVSFERLQLRPLRDLFDLLISVLRAPMKKPTQVSRSSLLVTLLKYFLSFVLVLSVSERQAISLMVLWPQVPRTSFHGCTFLCSSRYFFSHASHFSARTVAEVLGMGQLHL